MAKKRDELRQGLSNIFARTEPDSSGPADQVPENDPVKPIGVGLKDSEGKRLTQIAAELGVNRHALLLWLVRDFIRRYDAGERPETETRRVLKK